MGISLAKVHQEKSGGLFHGLDHNLDFGGKGGVGEPERVEVQEGVQDATRSARPRPHEN